MNDILFIIILIAIIAIGNLFSVKKEKENKKSSPPKPFGEVFPKVEEWSKPKQQPQPTRIHTQPNGQSTAYGQPIEEDESEHFFKNRKYHKDLQKAFVETPRSTNDVKTVTTLKEQANPTFNDIQLQTPEDARRAFIYSEIFKRKYE